jgi:hypothetical protein
VSIERNTVDIADIRISLDELPQFDSAFASIKVNEGDPTSRREGTSLIERRYTVDNTAGVARRMCVELSWPAEDKGFEVYSINVEIHPLEND